MDIQLIVVIFIVLICIGFVLYRIFRSGGDQGCSKGSCGGCSGGCDSH